MFLEKIRSPGDLRKLKIEELAVLATEIRQRMIEVVSISGGHLASSLGAVEVIIALHYSLDTPLDKIIFDVGHQAYAHKIITGRALEFSTIRQYKGLSGFPSRVESPEYDIFTTGHSSNAVSLALGLACGRDILPEQKHFKVVALIGDGSLSGGLCFEGLNNSGHLKKDILVVLNTNELSIAPNVGAISNYLNKIISLPVYNHFRDSLVNFLSSRGNRGKRLLRLANKFEEGLKGFFIPGVLFEELGFRYFGPLDGHNIDLLVRSFKNILNIKGPRIVHVVTKKGKGYSSAESEPIRFHGIGPFDIQTGSILQKQSGQKSYTDIFSEKLLELAKEDNKIVAVTAAMPEGTGLDKFHKSFPERFFDVGIAEGHAVTFSAGLSRSGLKPVIAIYSTFLQRAYDQIIEDVALQDLAVVFCIDRAGIVGEDGVTHQGIFDIGFLNTVPNLVNMAPKDSLELEDMLKFALKLGKPVTIRYPRGYAPLGENSRKREIELGKFEILRPGEDLAIIALGSMVSLSMEAADIVLKSGLSTEVINARFINPLDIEALRILNKRFKFIFTIEEGIIDTGFGSMVEGVIGKSIVKIGLPRKFIPHGKRDLLLEKYGLSAVGIADKVVKTVCRK
jgi:1-deoxy-D-xylulose-5-phosphate synthase